MTGQIGSDRDRDTDDETGVCDRLSLSRPRDVVKFLAGLFEVLYECICHTYISKAPKQKPLGGLMRGYYTQIKQKSTAPHCFQYGAVTIGFCIHPPLSKRMVKKNLADFVCNRDVGRYLVLPHRNLRCWC